jgi:2-dehydro-3-deoxy-D-arabinonate dehydratase
MRREQSPSLIVQDDSAAYDLTETDPAPTTFEDLAAAASLVDESIDDVARKRIPEAPEVNLEAVQDQLVRPLNPGEIWAAGVTYAISKESREAEGGLAESYINAYESERPEIYFKATPSRTVGPNDHVGVRGDSDWDVPEPELTLVLYDGDIVGYTIGNDVSSRSIERENLLYLPQSKIYSKSCALGPCIVTEETIGDPLDVEMRMQIIREGETVFEGSTSTDQMVRTCEELAGFCMRYNDIPKTTALLTGTSIIPPDDVSLRADDTVSIEIENIGRLENSVEEL